MILQDLRAQRPSMWARAEGDVPAPYGYVMRGCQVDNCNYIPDEEIINPWTGYSTGEYVCPTDEAAEEGIECYEGPWEVMPVSEFGRLVPLLEDPREECQGGTYEWNFCKNRKTYNGRPFLRCCSFAYLNAQSQSECRFVGLPGGTCDEYVELLRYELSSSSFTAITNTLTMKDCNEDGCNDPRDPVEGCPELVDEFPAITASYRVVEDRDPTPEELASGDPPAHVDDGPPMEAIAAASLIGAGVCVGALIACQMSKTHEISPWHSEAAKVVAHDLWIEPTNQPGMNMDYGLVKPTPAGFKALHDTKEVPEYLRRERELALEEEERVEVAAVADKADPQPRRRVSIAESHRTSISQAPHALADVSHDDVRAMSRDVSPARSKSPTDARRHSASQALVLAASSEDGPVPGQVALPEVPPVPVLSLTEVQAANHAAAQQLAFTNATASVEPGICERERKARADAAYANSQLLLQPTVLGAEALHQETRHGRVAARGRPAAAARMARAGAVHGRVT